jgi:hypothetical protein
MRTWRPPVWRFAKKSAGIFGKGLQWRTIRSHSTAFLFLYLYVQEDGFCQFAEKTRASSRQCDEECARSVFEFPCGRGDPADER